MFSYSVLKLLLVGLRQLILVLYYGRFYFYFSLKYCNLKDLTLEML